MPNVIILKSTLFQFLATASARGRHWTVDTRIHHAAHMRSSCNAFASTLSTLAPGKFRLEYHTQDMKPFTLGEIGTPQINSSCAKFEYWSNTGSKSRIATRKLEIWGGNLNPGWSISIAKDQRIQQEQIASVASESQQSRHHSAKLSQLLQQMIPQILNLYRHMFSQLANITKSNLKTKS